MTTPDTDPELPDVDLAGDPDWQDKVWDRVERPVSGWLLIPIAIAAGVLIGLASVALVELWGAL